MVLLGGAKFFKTSNLAKFLDRIKYNTGLILSYTLIISLKSARGKTYYFTNPMELSAR